MQFFTFSDVFESFLMRLDLFGCVPMQSDAFWCVGKRFDTSGNFYICLIFSNDSGDFWSVFGLGAYFYGRFTYRGAYYYRG